MRKTIMGVLGLLIVVGIETASAQDDSGFTNRPGQYITDETGAVHWCDGPDCIHTGVYKDIDQPSPQPEKSQSEKSQ